MMSHAELCHRSCLLTHLQERQDYDQAYNGFSRWNALGVLL